MCERRISVFGTIGLNDTVLNVVRSNEAHFVVTVIKLPYYFHYFIIFISGSNITNYVLYFNSFCLDRLFSFKISANMRNVISKRVSRCRLVCTLYV